MRFRLAVALSLAAAAFAGPLVAPAGAANAATDEIVPAGQVGADASFPQCKDDGRSPQLEQPLPVDPAFGIVGVNGGLGNTNNGCFAAQLQWALGSTAVTSQPRVGLYVNTQNPGLEASWWPSGNATQVGTPVDNPFGTCAGDAGRACSYVYGYSMAQADATPAVRHVAMPAAYTWWLDIETSNDWSGDRTANRAVLEGMVAAFGDVDAQVGLYSTHMQWDAIVGRLPASSPLAVLPSWLAGAVTQRGAAENCTHAPLTGGRVTLAQWWDRDRDLDFDLPCGQFSVTRIPTVSGTARVGSRLTASAGTWAPGGVTFGYHWLRNGQAIAGATHASYRLSAADAGARISVRVTGTKLAYSRTSRTSSAVRVEGSLAPATPTITGSTASGATLTAHAGRWKPAAVALHYQWRRDGAPIARATGARHVVRTKDRGHRLAVTVTGTLGGHLTAHRTSAARTIPGPPAVQPSTVAPARPAAPTVPPSTVPATGASRTAPAPAPSAVTLPDPPPSIAATLLPTISGGASSLVAPEPQGSRILPLRTQAR